MAGGALMPLTLQHKRKSFTVQYWHTHLLIKAYIHDIVLGDSAFSYRILAASFNTTVVNRVNKSEDQNISLLFILQKLALNTTCTMS